MGRPPKAASAPVEATSGEVSTPVEAQPPTFIPDINIANLPTPSTLFPGMAEFAESDGGEDSGEPEPPLDLSNLEMMAREFANNDYDDDDEEALDEDEDEDLADNLRLLKGGDDEEPEADGQEDEGAEDEETEESDTDTESAQEKESPLDPRVAAQLDAVNKQLAALEAQRQQYAEAAAKAEAERLRASKEAELITERGKQIVAIQEKIRAEYDQLEDLDPKAFNALVTAELREWESSARGKIDAELREAETKRLEEAAAEAKIAARDAEIETFLAALPEGARLLGHKTTSTEGTLGQLVAEIYRLGADNGAITAPFPEFAKAMASEFQGIYESGRKVGQTQAAKRLAKGASAPPPVTNRGGSGKTETRPQPKGIFSQEGMRDFFAGKRDISLFSEITTPSRKRR